MSGLSKLAIVGSGGHGLVVADAVLGRGDHQLVGFVSDGDASAIAEVGPLLGGQDCLPALIASGQVDALAIAIGDNHVRREVLQKLRICLPESVQFPAVIHPAACLGVVGSVGQGSVILAGAVIGPGAHVGEGCIVNTRASLDHHGALGNFGSLAPGVVTGGNVKVGEGTTVCIGATVLHGRTLGAWSVVGAGSVVVDDLPDGVVAYGTPARVVRKRELGDRYL